MMDKPSCSSVLVTGASSGIGRAVAIDLATQGINVVAVARREDRLEELQSDFAQRIFPIVGDIESPDVIQHALDQCIEQFGQCDGAIHAAGIMHAGSIEDVDIDKICSMVRLNLESAIRFSYVLLKHFRKVDKGHLVHISSILGTKVRPGVGAYAATKYGIEAFAESIRIELAKSNVQISVIEPGVTESELQLHFPVQPRDALGINKVLDPEDVARLVRFVLSQPAHVRIPVSMIIPGEQAM